jgi:hypothetical protein
VEEEEAGNVCVEKVCVVYGSLKLAHKVEGRKGERGE